MALAEARSGHEGGAASEARLDATARSENFPVASCLLPARQRARVMAFYRFARSADDTADDPSSNAETRVARLRALEAGLSGHEMTGPGADLFHALRAGRAASDARALAAARDLLPAFLRDARGTSCTDWADLMDYCASSAAPVGRFLLAIHEEDADAHAASDALCAALQVLNHCQDIQVDWRDLNRRYLPGDWMEEEGATDADLAEPQASPALRRVIDRTLAACDDLLEQAAPLPSLIAARGLGGQAAATLSLARRLRRRLGRGDPLARRIALSRSDFLMAGATGLWAAI